MRHGIRVVCGLQFQPGALGVLFQQSLAFQAAAYTLTDQLNQILEVRSGYVIACLLLFDESSLEMQVREIHREYGSDLPDAGFHDKTAHVRCVATRSY